MHKDKNLKDLKISADLKNKIINEYKEEKKKPKYKFREFLEYEIEIPKIAIAIALILVITMPVIDTIKKVDDLTYYKMESGEKINEDSKGKHEREIYKNKN